MPNSILKKSVPFIAPSVRTAGATICLLDRVEIPLLAVEEDNLIGRIRCNITLIGSDLVSAASTTKLVEQQLDSGLELAYSDPYWQELRDGDPHRGITAYLLETAHYLDAASYRM